MAFDLSSAEPDIILRDSEFDRVRDQRQQDVPADESPPTINRSAFDLSSAEPDISPSEVSPELVPSGLTAAIPDVDDQQELAETGVEEALRNIPGFSEIAEFASSVNRPVLETLDFLGPDTVNAILGLAGTDVRVPTLAGSIPGTEGGFIEPGLTRDVIRAAGETSTLAAGGGALLRGLASRLPSVAAAGESIGAGTLRQVAGTTATEDVALGLVSGAGGAIGKEFGGDTGELAGSIAAPILPVIAKQGLSSAVRSIFRGGEEGRQAVDESIKAFDVSGSTPTLGQATGRPSLQAIESTSGKAPGGRPLRDQLDDVSSNIQGKLQTIADDLSGVQGEEAAGRVIQRGITGDDGFVSRFRSKSNELWNNLDKAVSPETNATVTNTKQALDDLVRGDDFGGILDNPQLVQIKNVLDESGESITYETLKDLRGLIGRRLGSNDLISDIPRAELKQLYGAMTDDIKAVAGSVSDDALKSFNRANSFTRAGHSRLDDFVERVTNKVDLDKVFRAVTRGGEGSQTVNAFKRSLTPDEWNVVTSNVIRRLGKASPGQQDALGEAFSLNKFLTDWNKLGDAKNAMFSGTKQLNVLRDDLDKIAKTASRVKDASRELAGQSGTAQLATSIGTGGVATGALLSGNLKVAGSVLALVAANNGAARLMSSPKFVKWLSQSTNINESQLPAQIAKLPALINKSNPEDAKAISQFIEDAKGGEEQAQTQAAQN